MSLKEFFMIGEKRRTFLVNFAYFGVITLIVVAMLRYALPMLAPFVIAFLLAYLLKPVVRFLRNKIKLPGKLAPITAVILFYGIIGSLVAWLGVAAVSGLVELIKKIPVIYETHMIPFFMDIMRNLQAIFDELDPAIVNVLNNVGNQFLSSLGQMVSNLSVSAMSFASSFASSLPGLFIKLVVMIICTFFIAVDYEKLRDFCMRQMNDTAKELFIQIKEYVIGTLFVCIRSYAIIMTITFVELSVGLSIVGIKHAVLTAFCISVFDILPVLGTGGIMIPWVVLTLIQGQYVRALGLLLVYIVITVIRNIIEPKIVGSQLGLHPVVTLASMFAGAQLFGIIGLFGFPIGLSLLCYLNSHGVVKILK